MSNAAGRSWWASMGFGQKFGARPRASSQPDFADMGTAFGLDASMDTVVGSPNEEGRPVTEAPLSSDRPGRGDRRRD